MKVIVYRSLKAITKEEHELDLAVSLSLESLKVTIAKSVVSSFHHLCPPSSLPMLQLK